MAVYRSRIEKFCTFAAASFVQAVREKTPERKARNRYRSPQNDTV